VHPSMRAASPSSSGMVKKNCRIKKMLNAPQERGNPQRVERAHETESD
jgi:hypothetical protein